MGDPFDHNQREGDKGQNDHKRRHAQTPTQRTGLGHIARPVSQILRNSERFPYREIFRPLGPSNNVGALRRILRLPEAKARSWPPPSPVNACSGLPSCNGGPSLKRACSLSRKRSSDCTDADDDPSLVIQDMDLPSSLALELSHTENSTPDGFEIGCRMTLAGQARPIPADQAEFVIWHGVSSSRHPQPAKRATRLKVPSARRSFRGVQTGDIACGLRLAGRCFRRVLCDFRSKNRAWLITALTESALNGLVMRNAGSGACPVRKRSGKAVMKITGTS